MQHLAYGKGALNLGCNGLDILINVVQRLFEKAASLIQLDNKATFGAEAIVDIAGTGIHLDGFGLRIDTQNTDIVILFFQNFYQCFCTVPSGIQKFRKSHF